MTLLVVVYLAAIVAANLTVAAFGPSISIFNAFLLIGLDLSTRDALHERWQHRHLLLKMATLVATGSLLSWLLNRDAGRIALASAVAFGAAAATDTLIYHLLRRTSRLQRMNGSNSVSAAVDSILFPTIAFGGFMPLITLGQYVAKVGGGAVWAWILNRRRLSIDVWERKDSFTCDLCRGSGLRPLYVGYGMFKESTCPKCLGEGVVASDNQRASKPAPVQP